MCSVSTKRYNFLLVEYHNFSCTKRERYMGKKKEFLELKQGNMTVSEYEREFVRLSKYAREWVLTEVEMCKRFEKGLNEDIKLLIEILKIREFSVLAGRAHKARN
ncbi:26S proteasome non-ATPase regulatory subunit 1-like protein A-like [Gossypium australe]|uniref:26S proteasome non-ATPase regulatory subunit 1-like protein A-like n=1 Tax=Gossypium australe TaxID=47621 RepID=A0A5B6VW02_9ROSI|nr:26S proteasome non-ATPase regulatory subunit 1-like protein A-like [Gossypium australe]